MNKTKTVIILLALYVIFYKLYLSFQGVIFTYIVNPLVWIILAIISHYFIKNRRRKEMDKQIRVLIVTIIVSLIYVIIYYTLGLVVGYTNNPYSTTVSGYIINLFSIWFVTTAKEYIRYLCMNIVTIKYKSLYFIVLFLIFFASDLNVLSIMNTNDLLILWTKELTVPLSVNLFMMYLSYVGDYKASIVSRTIIILPSIFFNVVPDYDWFIIMVLNIIYCLLTYLIIQYSINKRGRDRVIKMPFFYHIKRKIIFGMTALVAIFFGMGIFSFKPLVILTGSMSPLLNPGDLTIIRKCKPGDLVIGDVIEYQLEDVSIVHRIIYITYIDGQPNFITKGDANKKIDKKPVKSEQITGKLEYNIPYIGYPAYLIRNIVNTKNVDIEYGGDNNGK